MYKRSLFSGLLTAVLIMALDQLSKWHMLEIVDIANRPAIEVTPFFNLVKVWNPGMSFGMLQNVENGAMLLSAVAVIIIAILTLWLARTQSKLEIYGIGLVIGGAIGNLIDRFRFGAVADFYDFHIAGYHWPAFNIADSAICIGAVLLAIYALSSNAKNAKNMPHENKGKVI